MLKRTLIVSAAAVMTLGASATFAAEAEPRYVAKRIQQAPSRYTTVIVRVEPVRTSEQAPYALTGAEQRSEIRRDRAPHVPTHVKGPRSNW